MRKYDNATLDAVIKEAEKSIETANKDKEAMLNNPDIRDLEKLRLQNTRLPEQKKAEQLIKIANRIKEARAKVKKHMHLIQIVKLKIPLQTILLKKLEKHLLTLVNTYSVQLKI